MARTRYRIFAVWQIAVTLNFVLNVGFSPQVNSYSLVNELVDT